MINTELIIYGIIAVLGVIIVYNITHHHGIFMEAVGIINAIIWLSIGQHNLRKINIELNVPDVKYEDESPIINMPYTVISGVEAVHNTDDDVIEDEATRLINAGFAGRKKIEDFDSKRMAADYERYSRRVGANHRIDATTAATFVDQLYKEEDAWYNEY